MAGNDVETRLDRRFSSPGGTVTSWTRGRDVLERAEIYWLTTVRPEERPHVTPLIAVWQDHALYFCTGPDERKAKNLAANPHCIVTTGCNTMGDGLDVVVEGDAVRVDDEHRLQRLAEAYKTKYGWHFAVRNGAFYDEEGGRAVVYEVAPTTAFGFGKGEQFSQTRWRF
jgi:hypothetical protein